jgi:WD40 repeat protein
MRRYKLTQTEAVRGLHFTPCGTRLLACVGTERSWVSGAILLDLVTGDERSRVEQPGVCYAVPPDASRFVLGGANQDANELGGIVWSNLPDLASWERQRWLKRSLPPQYAGVYGLSFDPTGTRLAVAHLRTRGMRRTRRAPRLHLTVTDPYTGEEEYSLPVSRVTDVLTFSTDDARLAATGGTGHDPGVTVFDLAARIPVSALGLPGATTLALRFLPDGRLAVANGASVFVLRADGGQQFALHGHTQPVNALAVTPDGKRLLSASADGTVRMWDARTGDALTAYNWKIGRVTALACAPDGLTCAAAGTGGNVVLWDADG